VLVIVVVPSKPPGLKIESVPSTPFDPDGAPDEPPPPTVIVYSPVVKVDKADPCNGLGPYPEALYPPAPPPPPIQPPPPPPATTK
jgi:RNA polymerase II-associated factor 1